MIHVVTMLALDAGRVLAHQRQFADARGRGASEVKISHTAAAYFFSSFLIPFHFSGYV